MYWKAASFTGNDNTWYFTDDPDNLGGNELSAGDLEYEGKGYLKEYRLLPNYKWGQFLVIKKDADKGRLRINELIMTFAEMREYQLARRECSSMTLKNKREIL